MKLSNLKIGNRLEAGFALIITFPVAIGITAGIRMTELHQRMTTITEVNKARGERQVRVA